MNQAALNAFLQELKTSINKLESALTDPQEPKKESSLWYPPADKNYGPWIEHRGNIPPVPYGTQIQRLSRAERHDRRFNAKEDESACDLWHDGIVAYRLQKQEEKPWYPEDCEGFGPWIDTATQTSYPLFSGSTPGQVLLFIERHEKSWDPKVVDLNEEDLCYGRRNYSVVAYRLKNQSEEEYDELPKPLSPQNHSYSRVLP